MKRLLHLVRCEYFSISSDAFLYVRDRVLEVEDTRPNRFTDDMILRYWGNENYDYTTEVGVRAGHDVSR
jgi:hypothetical protein